MKHFKKDTKPKDVISFPTKGNSTNILRGVSSNKLYKIVSVLKRKYINKSNEQIVVISQPKNLENYNVHYANSVIHFLDNLNASKKYEDLEIIVDSPKAIVK